MWRLHRHIFGSVALWSLGSVGFVVFLMVAANIMRDLLDYVSKGQITPEIFLQLLGLLIPYLFSYALPIGTLVGILIVMGRLSANHELTAMKASGISLWRISAPILLFAVLATGVASWINAIHAPAARASYKEILRNVVREDPLRFIVPRTFIHDFPGYVFFAHDKEGDTLINLWVWELDPEKRVLRLLRAERGRASFDPESDGLILTLENGFVELRDEDDPDKLSDVQPTLAFQDASVRFPLGDIFGRSVRATKLSYVPTEQKMGMRKEVLSELQSASEEEKPGLYKRQIQLQYKINESFVTAFSIFSFALMGIPLGVKASRSETIFNAVFAVMIAMGFYVLLVMISWMQEIPRFRPDIVVWLPNIVFQIIGVILLWRANRH